MVLRIRLTGADMARVRFGISVLSETVRSVQAIATPGEYAIHLPWIRWAAPRLPDDPDVRLFRRLLTGRGIPVSLLPPPDTRLPDFSHELRLVRRANPDRIRESLDAIFGRRRWLAEFYRDPPAVLDRLAAAIDRCHRAVIEPHWPRMRAVLEADIDYRARRLADGGIERVIRGLHREVRWSGAGEISLWSDGKAVEPAVLEMSGLGLVLNPSVFGWPHANSTQYPVGAAIIRYPARGIGTLWELPVRRPPAAISELLGGTRAAILVALAEPGDTPTLARRLGVTPGAVSQHLRVLRDAGLVATQRDGRTAVHLRTARADALLDLGPQSPHNTRE